MALFVRMFVVSMCARKPTGDLNKWQGKKKQLTSDE